MHYRRSSPRVHALNLPVGRCHHGDRGSGHHGKFKFLQFSFIIYFEMNSLIIMLSHFSHVRLVETLLTTACLAPSSIGFSRQESWSGLPCPPLGHIPDPGIEPVSPGTPALQADSLPGEPPGKPFSDNWLHVKSKGDLE